MVRRVHVKPLVFLGDNLLGEEESLIRGLVSSDAQHIFLGEWYCCFFLWTTLGYQIQLMVMFF